MLIDLKITFVECLKIVRDAGMLSGEYAVNLLERWAETLDAKNEEIAQLRLLTDDPVVEEKQIKKRRITL